MATNLAQALHEAGHEIVQVYSRTMASASALAVRVGAVPLCDVGQVVADADVYILAVKDDALPELIPQLAAGRKARVMLHTAGSVPMDVFQGMAFHYGVLYPLQTFSKDRRVSFAHLPMFVEGNDDEALAVAEQLATSVSDRVSRLSSPQRKYLHLAAVFACNFVNHCYELSAEQLAKHGIPFDVLLPLIDETAAKVHDMSPADAQTGPAIRYDETVIRMQSQLLADNPLQKDLYERMSLSIHQTAMKKND